MMDDAEEDVRYNNNARGEDVKLRAAEGYERGKGSERDGMYRNSPYGENEDEGEEENDEDDAVEVVEEDDDDDDDDEDGNGVQRIGNSDVNDGHAMDGAEKEKEKSGYKRRIEDIDFDRHPKKRRLKNLVSNYEFAPRLALTQAQPAAYTDANTVASASARPTLATNKQSFGGRNALADWTEHETFVLLDAWGDRFLQHGRKSLRSEEWQEVAEKVSQESRIERTDTQCRNRLDTLKKKFKTEKAKFGLAAGKSSKWIYFKKMNMLMSPRVKQPGLTRGIDSGEYVFSNPRGHMNRANGLGEMRYSADHSDSTEDDSGGLPPSSKVPARIANNHTNVHEEKECCPMKLLADSLNNFCKTYEKIENSKRQQLVELEKMRMDFHRDLEQEKKLILERAQAEIAKIWQGDNKENGGASGENISS